VKELPTGQREPGERRKKGPGWWNVKRATRLEETEIPKIVGKKREDLRQDPLKYLRPENDVANREKGEGKKKGE
jgi:hypothetical protein